MSKCKVCSLTSKFTVFSFPGSKSLISSGNIIQYIANISFVLSKYLLLWCLKCNVDGGRSNEGVSAFPWYPTFCSVAVAVITHEHQLREISEKSLSF